MAISAHGTDNQLGQSVVQGTVVASRLSDYGGWGDSEPLPGWNLYVDFAYEVNGKGYSGNQKIDLGDNLDGNSRLAKYSPSTKNPNPLQPRFS